MPDPAAERLGFDALYDRVCALPPGVTGEILRPGELRTMSRPGRAHRRAATGVFDALRGFDRTRNGTGWWVEVESEIRLGDRLLVPDLAGWRVENVPQLPDENPITLVPDWCCEVLSPTTARDDRTVKLPLYAAYGVRYVWLIDPQLQVVEVYRTESKLPSLTQSAIEGDATLLAPFDLPLDLARWWRDPAPSSDDGSSPPR